MSSSARSISRNVASLAKIHGSRRGVTKQLMASVASRGLHSQTHDFSTSQRVQFLRDIAKDESMRNTMGYSLSFAAVSNNKNDLSSDMFVPRPNVLMQRQLVNSQNQLRQHHDEWDDAPLPRTLEEALSPSHRNRAIVITETTVPFRIVDVNAAWEGLCGYSFVECQGKTLGSLLQGPETDRSAVTAVVYNLLRGEEGGAVLTNYTKDGRAFRNRLRVGPLMEDGEEETKFFIGVLQEIHDDFSMQQNAA